MPIYEYQCPVCEKKFDKYVPMKDYNEPQSCYCGATAQKIFSAPAVHGDFKPYSCPVTGKLIDGRRAHEENLKRTGCRVLESGETQAATAFRQRTDKELEDKVAETAGEFVSQLSSQETEQLGRELENGLDISLTRQ